MYLMIHEDMTIEQVVKFKDEWRGWIAEGIVTVITMKDGVFHEMMEDGTLDELPYMNPKDYE